MVTIPESLPSGLFPVAAITLLGILSLPTSLLLVRSIEIGIRMAACFDFFHPTPQNVLLNINFVFRRETFSAVVVRSNELLLGKLFVYFVLSFSSVLEIFSSV